MPAWPSRREIPPSRVLKPCSSQPRRAIGLGLFWLIAVNLYLYQKSRFPVWLLLGAGMGALLLGNRTAGWAGLVLLGCLAAEYLASRPHGGLPGLQ